MGQGALQTLLMRIRRGRGCIACCALEGIFLVDVVDQLLVNLEIHTLDPHMMVFLLGRWLLGRLWGSAFRLIIGKF